MTDLVGLEAVDNLSRPRAQPLPALINRRMASDTAKLSGDDAPPKRHRREQRPRGREVVVFWEH